MAQIIPPITSLPLDSIAAPSAEDIQDRLPSICVDYLSHDWSEEDVWASWRSMTRHKHEIANGVRLENASWRTWQKQRNKLKTISPETLNWLKDSDVTWLYGPLHTAHVEPVRPMKIATTEERLGIDSGAPPAKPANSPNTPAVRGPSKPILKHRTLSEMLTIPMPSSPILEATGRDDDFDDSDGGGRPILLQTKSDTNIANSRTSAVRKRSPPRMPISGKITPASGELTPEATPATASTGGKRHISFNTFVEQCVAIDEQQQNANDDDSEDEMLEMKSNSSRSSRPSLSRNSSSNSSDHITIAKIAPTMLKTNGTHAASNMPQMIYQPPPEYHSPPLTEASATSFDFPSPQVQQSRNKWSGEDDDEYGSVGFDYFGGPDLVGGTSEEARAPAHVGTSYARPPTVNQPPQQPKWRQPTAQPQAAQLSEPSSISSSTSSSSVNIASPPVPSRGILKVRAPGTTPPELPSPPQPSYFNYNPSPATGIGGMRGSYEYPTTLGTDGSPLVSPATESTRGRSAQRATGSSAAYDRSASRGTSASSPSTSTSPASARTPPLESRGRMVTSPAAGGVRSPTGTQPQPVPSVQQQQQQQQQQNQRVPPEIRAEMMDVDELYQPERNNTPTPHSSPQISLRPLQDTSPASLPHTSTRPAQNRSGSSHASNSSYPSNSLSPDLPKADPPTRVGGKATIAHTATNAQPTLSQPPNVNSDTESSDESTGDGDGGDLTDDGGTIMGRAANIASTAKDLLGALWYGANEGGNAPGGASKSVSGGVAGAAGAAGGVPASGAGASAAAAAAAAGSGNAGRRAGGHRRGASLG